MKKIFLLCVTLVIILSSLLIVPEDRIAEAETMPTPPEIDYEYIENITEYLSDIINTSYGENEIARGREFGSEGEHDAAEYLATQMKNNLNLFDPTNNSVKPHHQQLENTGKRGWGFYRDKEACHLQVLSKKLKIKNSTGSINEVECYISPIWRWPKKLRPRTGLYVWNTFNYSKDEIWLKVSRPPIEEICENHGNKYFAWLATFNNVVDLIKDLIDNNIDSYDSLTDYVIEGLEDYYDFDYDELETKPWSFPFFNDTCYNFTEKKVFIQEDPSFNPDVKLGDILKEIRPLSVLYAIKYVIYRVRLRFWNILYPKIVGLIRYDFNNDTHNMEYNYQYKLPIIYINKSVGEDIYNNNGSYQVKFYINQKWNNVIQSYNIIGQINGTHPDKNKTVILSSLYDAMWCQGTADSAIGCGIVMALAKYMKELESSGVKPRYNLKFILFAGEEFGMKGARYYANTTSDDIVAFIDLNQLGFKKHNATHPDLNLNIGTNRIKQEALIEKCASKTNYEKRLPSGDNTGFNVDWYPTYERRKISFSGVSNNKAFWEDHTILFLKDTGWTYHHRDGLNHTKGDSMSYYYPQDVNLTAEMVLNVTKLYAYNPNCSFVSISHDFNDSLDDSNTYKDSVNISYTIDTIMPEDRVMVLAYLQCEDKKYNNSLFRYPINLITKEYTVTSSYINDNLTIKLPKRAPKGNYTLNVFLFNSSGQIREQAWNPYHIESDSKEFANATYESIKVIMAPKNDIPNTPSAPSGPTTVDAYTLYEYTTNTTDPDGDDVYYQWAWRFNKKYRDLRPRVLFKSYSSGDDCTVKHLWHSDGEVEVRVRAKDTLLNPGYWSNWSDPLTVTVDKDCWFNSENVAVVDYPLYCNGFVTGLSGELTWEYDFDISEKRGESKQQNSNCTYNENETGMRTINLTVNNSEYIVDFSKEVKVVFIKADFNVSSIGAQPNSTIVFNDTSISYSDLANWTWDFGDGTISYEQNFTHNYTTCGEFNVTLTVRDNSTPTPHTSNTSKIIYIELDPPDFYWVTISQEITALSSNITIYADFYDNKSGIGNIELNVTKPDGSYSVFNMTSSYSDHEFEHIFNNTTLAGGYKYAINVSDNASNSNSSAGYTFNVYHVFGNTTSGNSSQNITDRISGSVFKVLVNGTADNIIAYIQSNLGTPPNTKCMIYRKNDSSLVGTTDELTPNTGDDPKWVVFNFSGTKPNLVNDTEYVLSCWSDDTCYLYYGNVTAEIGRYNNSSIYISSPPNPVNWTDNETRSYSIYCSYTTTPEITNVGHSKDTIGLGMDATIDVEVNSHGCAIRETTVNITHPDNTNSNRTMENTGNNVFEIEFDDTWLVGQYNYSIWTVDAFGAVCNSSGHSFNVSTNATISICTIKDDYEENETINLTDPPDENLPLIGYEMLDDGDVLHIWNKYDSYYFDTDSGIQLTNHYNEYWSHNVLMLGYYNNDQWNLIYRTDELSGFNKEIDTDNGTYVNATLWKNLAYGGYNFRLAIRYCLGVDDNELTVIPYIKNLDEDDIPYTLGFGWEMKDIQIDMTETGDYIEVNRTKYYLNQTLDNTYINLPEPEFYLIENITDTSTKALYLKWNQSLTYKLQVKSRDGQYNAPVTLFVRIGTLASGQEKYTKMYWYDADQVTYYFDGYDNSEVWTISPWYMVDGYGYNYASTTSDGDIELCDGNDCSGSDIGEISAVELRLCAYYTGGSRNIFIRPVFGGTTDGLNIQYSPTNNAGVWSPWYEITRDPYAPTTWTWTDIDNLDCDVEVVNDPMGPPFTMYCSKIEIRVTYTPYNPPGISNPYPANGSTGVTTFPMLNITVSDAEGDSMNITWLSNSSGSWQVFGTNNSINNGTYHQVFSNASTNAQWWYWRVNVTDGTNYTESDVYKFYTGCQSKIVNTGSCHFKGYLIINIDFYNDTSEEWELVFEVIDDTSMTTFLWADPMGAVGQQVFALDTVFNDLVNTSYITNYTDYGNGTYRVYVALTDPYGDVLVTGDETELEATYEFTVTFD